MNILLFISTLIIILITAATIYFIRVFNYWKRKKVPYIEPKFPFGTIENPFTRTEPACMRIRKQYQYLKSQGYKHGGLYIFSKPVYLPIDLDYVRNIMTKDFQYFTDRGTYYNERDDPLSVNLMHTEGQRWKNLRTRLTPAFTIGKTKLLYTKIIACSNELIEVVDKFSEERKPIDAKDLSSSFTVDVTVSTIFGLNANCLTDANNLFKTYGNKFLSPKQNLQAIKSIIITENPKLGRLLKMSTASLEMSKFFLNLVKDIIEQRERTNSSKKDFIQILVDLKHEFVENKRKKTSNQDRIIFTKTEIAAQAFAIFMAGYETSATTMSFCLYELALNTKIQEKLRKEVFGAFEDCNQSINYEKLAEMKYLDQVVSETLRKYPPISLLLRKCVKDYQVPESHVIIEKGTRVIIPILPLHYDSEYHSDPDKFDPDRFSSQNKKFMQPFSYIPFGMGPRNCIGSNIGLIQVKVALAYLLRHFRFSLNTNTNVPLIMDPFTFILTPKGGIWIDVEKI